MTSSQMEPGESVIFQPVLQAYPTRHSWIITAHIITWQFGMTLETFQQATNQHITIPQVIGPTSFSTNTTPHHTPIGIM